MTPKKITLAFVFQTLMICAMSAAYINETIKVDQLKQQQYVYIQPQIPHSIMLQFMNKRGCAIYFNTLFCSPHFISKRLYNT